MTPRFGYSEEPEPVYEPSAPQYIEQKVDNKEKNDNRNSDSNNLKRLGKNNIGEGNGEHLRRSKRIRIRPRP